MVQKILAFLDNLAYRLQLAYMRPKITRERVGRHYAFFHPRPTGEIILKKYKQRTRKILVTGCFDVLHSEHKKLLRAAKKLGGQLSVGVETDTRVRQLKGPGRPINSLTVRLANLRRLKIAGQVLALPEKFKDFSGFIKKLRPDILAVSANTPNLAIKRQMLKKIGGRVMVVLPYNPQISTTKMLKSRR